jgi:ATP-dependent DNA helicase RecG
MSLSAEQVTAKIKAGQNEQFHWIKAAPDAATLCPTLTAMANGRGGWVVVGVESANNITGVNDDQAVIDTLIGATMTLTPPLITPLPEIISVDDKKLAVLEIPAGMPHVYTHDGHYLIRQGNQNTPLMPQALRRLMLERGELNYETNAAPNTTLEDLDWGKVLAYMATLRIPAQDAKITLYKRGCLLKTGTTYTPTNAGILLFGKSPKTIVHSAEITAVRFAGTTMSDTFSRQDISGTLPDQIRRAETFLVDHLRRGVKLKGSMARQEAFEYPMEAAREIVVNAVAHRDYSISGDNIRLLLFKDRMEVHSPGNLPGPVTVDNIKDERFSRNPIIVQVLADMGFIERLGYGIDRIFDLMTQNALQHPNFTETAGGFRVRLYNKAEALPEATAVAIPTDTPLNSRQEAAIAYLNQPDKTRITNSELQQMYPDVHAETIRRDLADLVSKDMLVKMGQKRGSYYVLKRDA